MKSAWRPAHFFGIVLCNEEYVEVDTTLYGNGPMATINHDLKEAYWAMSPWFFVLRRDRKACHILGKFTCIFISTDCLVIDAGTMLLYQPLSLTRCAVASPQDGI